MKKECIHARHTLYFGIEAKQPKQTISKQTETNQRNPKFSEKIPNMLPIKLFWLVFCLFRFNQNIENLCLGIKAKQLKQTFCFG
jgi:hypothetical protein